MLLLLSSEDNFLSLIFLTNEVNDCEVISTLFYNLRNNKKSSLSSGEFLIICSLIFSLLTSSDLNFKVVSATDVSGSTLSVFNSFKFFYKFKN